MTLHPIPLNFLIYEERFIFFFISVRAEVTIIKVQTSTRCIKVIYRIKYLEKCITVEFSNSKSKTVSTKKTST